MFLHKTSDIWFSKSITDNDFINLNILISCFNYIVYNFLCMFEYISRNVWWVSDLKKTNFLYTTSQFLFILFLSLVSFRLILMFDTKHEYNAVVVFFFCFFFKYCSLAIRYYCLSCPWFRFYCSRWRLIPNINLNGGYKSSINFIQFTNYEKL